MNVLWNKFKEPVTALASIVTIIMVFADVDKKYQIYLCIIVLLYLFAVGIGIEYAKSLSDSLYLFFEKILMCRIESLNKTSKNSNTNKFPQKGHQNKVKEYKLKKSIEKSKNKGSGKS